MYFSVLFEKGNKSFQFCSSRDKLVDYYSWILVEQQNDYKEMIG